MSEALPSTIESEQAVLGAMLMEPEACDAVDGRITESDFFDALNGRIFSEVMGRFKLGRNFDPISIKNAMEKDAAFADVGGCAKYLGLLVECAAPDAAVTSYADMIRDMSVRRGVISHSKAAQTLADDDREKSGVEIAADLEREMSGLQDAGVTAVSFSGAVDGIIQIDGALEDARAAEGVTGIKTGLNALDERTAGLQRGNMCVIAGRPSMGKTALAGSIAYKAAQEEGQKVFFDSLEMTRRQVWQRIIVDEMRSLGGQTNLSMFRKGIISRADEKIFKEAKEKIGNINGRFLVDDQRNMTVTDIRHRCRAARREMQGLDLVVIDYLGLIRKPDFKGRNESSVIGEMTWELKCLAGELDVPVVVLSQLSRQCEMRDNKRPMLSDLRSSGDIEQDADDVFFVYRDAYYIERELAALSRGSKEYSKLEEELLLVQRNLEIICAKQRQGPIGTDTVLYEPQYNHIENMPRDQ